jgi:hypothetical protein
MKKMDKFNKPPKSKNIEDEEKDEELEDQLESEILDLLNDLGLLRTSLPEDDWIRIMNEIDLKVKALPEKHRKEGLLEVKRLAEETFNLLKLKNEGGNVQ